MRPISTILADTLERLRRNVYPTSITYRTYLTPAFQQRLATGIDANDAEALTQFIRGAAVEARAPEIVGLCEVVLAEIKRVERENPQEDTGPEPPQFRRRTNYLGTQLPGFWKEHVEREQKWAAQPARRMARWEQRDMVTTSDIAARLWPPEEVSGFGTTYLFHILKDMGYVSGAPREWALTPKADGLGEVRAKPGGPRHIFWKKEMFDIVKPEVDRRHPAGSYGRPGTSPPVSDDNVQQVDAGGAASDDLSDAPD